MLQNEKEFQAYYHFRTGLDCSHLIGKYYNCIFDERKGECNKSRPHKHKILDAFHVKRDGYIYSGIAIKISNVGFFCEKTENFIRSWLYGVDEKHITKEK